MVASLGFIEKCLKKNKFPVNGNYVGKNALLMPEVRVEWPDWFELREREQLE